MAAYREVRQLSAADAAYLAGLIDGEGTVTLSRKHAGDMRQLVYSYAVWNRQALALLAQVEPYMRSYKVERARLALRTTCD